MKALVSFPGRAGDLLWGCCAIRALSATIGAPVDLQVAGEFESLVPLLAQQPYLGRVWADPTWSMSHSVQAPTASRGDRRYDFSADAGYKRWPELPLPMEVWADLTAQFPGELTPLDLHRPWITVKSPKPLAKVDVVVGFTECHFELKFGLLELLFPADPDRDPLWESLSCMAPGSRWEKEGAYIACDWLTAAQYISQGKVMLTDCSALHVLACALGKPCVIMEPMPERLNPIFWPLGKDGPQVTLVRGNDGEATFDARHTAETLERILGASHAR